MGLRPFLTFCCEKQKTDGPQQAGLSGFAALATKRTPRERGGLAFLLKPAAVCVVKEKENV